MSSAVAPCDQPWLAEPEQMDFDAHGLKCAMRRGPGGHWCAYVGIPASHPLHGKGYGDKVVAPPSLLERPLDIDAVGAINVFCAIAEEIKDGIAPIDLLLDCHGGLTYASDAHPGGKKDGLWWFGFDCAHSDDLCPKYDWKHGGVYRTAEYTKGVAERLAQQLAAWPTPEAQP